MTTNRDVEQQVYSTGKLLSMRRFYPFYLHLGLESRDGVRNQNYSYGISCSLLKFLGVLDPPCERIYGPVSVCSTNNKGQDTHSALAPAPIPLTEQTNAALTHPCQTQEFYNLCHSWQPLAYRNNKTAPFFQLSCEIVWSNHINARPSRKLLSSRPFQNRRSDLVRSQVSSTLAEIRGDLIGLNYSSHL